MIFLFERRPASADFCMKVLLQRLEAPTSEFSASVPSFRLPGRVLYAVNHCFPYSSNGYAVRTHGVAAGLVQSGCSVVAASRPGVPWDQLGDDAVGVDLHHDIDGVRYVHSRTPSQRGMALEAYLEGSVPVLASLMRVFKPAVVMAASNWRNALSAAIAARELGLPFFYEVRGFWEISQAAREPGWEHTPEFSHEMARETAVAKAAQRVFTLNRFMRDELVRRGVPAERIELVPNGFPGWADAPTTPLARADLGISSRFVAGYVGSFNVYEGLEELIEALAVVRRLGVDAALLLVGSGEPSGFATGVCPKTAEYRLLAERLGVGEFVFMPGRVAPEQAAAYYALLDVVVIPRRPFPVCELVSPMKPLEAAAHGKRVLMSDVAPLADLAGLCANFSYFSKGSVASLADKLVALAAAPVKVLPRCEALAERTWEENVAPMAAAIRSASRTAVLPVPTKGGGCIYC
jgi:glycosyltransferase involved in cell wall biosynthesis